MNAAAAHANSGRILILRYSTNKCSTNEKINKIYTEIPVRVRLCIALCGPPRVQVRVNCGRWENDCRLWWVTIVIFSVMRIFLLRIIFCVGRCCCCCSPLVFFFLFTFLPRFISTLGSTILRLYGSFSLRGRWNIFREKSIFRVEHGVEGMCGMNACSLHPMLTVSPFIIRCNMMGIIVPYSLM